MHTHQCFRMNHSNCSKWRIQILLVGPSTFDNFFWSAKKITQTFFSHFSFFSKDLSIKIGTTHPTGLLQTGRRYSEQNELRFVASISIFKKVTHHTCGYEKHCCWALTASFLLFHKMCVPRTFSNSWVKYISELALAWEGGLERSSLWIDLSERSTFFLKGGRCWIDLVYCTHIDPTLKMFLLSIIVHL